MRAAGDIAWNVQSMPMNGRRIFNPINHIEGQGLPLLHPQDRTKVIVINAVSGACGTIAEIMRRFLQFQANAVINAAHQIGHRDNRQRACALLRPGQTAARCHREGTRRFQKCASVHW